MTIKAREIALDDKRRILRLEEGHFHDLKSIDVKPGKLSRSLSAFANAAGGELYIGVDETKRDGKKYRKWRGFDDPESANDHIAVFDQLFPLGEPTSCEFLSLKGARGYVLHVEVTKTADVVEASDGTAYLRRGAQNLPQTDSKQLKRLRLAKGVVSFETETVNVDINVVQKSVVLRRFVKEAVPRTTPRAWLGRQLFMREGKPTVAAVLLYAEEPQAALPKRCGIKIYRYETSASEGTRKTLSFTPITVEGCLYDQIEAAVIKTRELVEGIQALGPGGLERIEYPDEALHEIITNAVIHRDYSIASDIHIRIFDNRIEVESPGTLPGHVTVKNILQEQFARNGAIVRILNKFSDPPNKDVGEGLNTAFQAMKRLRLKEPVIEEHENKVVVQIKHERLASPEEAVLEFLKTNEEIANREGRELTGIESENVMKEVFYRLRDRDQIERVPGRSGSRSAWRRKKQRKR